MNANDAIGSAVVLSFGLWWVVSPESVIRFYTWFHRGRAALPGARRVRIAGTLWLAIAGAVLWSVLGR